MLQQTLLVGNRTGKPAMPVPISVASRLQAVLRVDIMGRTATAVSKLGHRLLQRRITTATSPQQKPLPAPLSRRTVLSKTTGTAANSMGKPQPLKRRITTTVIQQQKHSAARALRSHRMGLSRAATMAVTSSVKAPLPLRQAATATPRLKHLEVELQPRTTATDSMARVHHMAKAQVLGTTRDHLRVRQPTHSLGVRRQSRKQVRQHSVDCVRLLLRRDRLTSSKQRRLMPSRHFREVVAPRRHMQSNIARMCWQTRRRCGRRATRAT